MARLMAGTAGFDKPGAGGEERAMKIAVVAPACPIEIAVAEAVDAIVAEHYPGTHLVYDPQCFLQHGHFAGDDQVREEAFVTAANDPSIDALWFARGGYGSFRFAERALSRLGSAAGDKAYLGYSDGGTLLAGLYARGIGRPAHGPMLGDIRRSSGETAVRRALDWLTGRDPRTTLDAAVLGKGPYAAFNLTVLSHLLGTALEPDLTAHELLLEDVDEYHYRIDRTLFHVTSADSIRRVKGIRRGRFTVPQNDRAFGADEDAIFHHWCEASGIAYLGTADIGHDAENKIVPFGVGRSS